ncbi:hypothetical protein ACXNSR_28350 [Streptomyces sp. NC-S4]
MLDGRWFVDDHDDDSDLDATEAAFVSALRDRAAAWRVPPAYSCVSRTEDESALLVCVSFTDEGERNVRLGEWAVHFRGADVSAGRVCDQLFNLHESPESGFFRATGTPEALAERCAAWFEAVLSRPVGRMQWLHEDKVYATQWMFADTGEGLVGGYDNRLAPSPLEGWGAYPSSPHALCTLVRGGSGPQHGPHAPECREASRAGTSTAHAAAAPAASEPPPRRWGARLTGRRLPWRRG